MSDMHPAIANIIAELISLFIFEIAATIMVLSFWINLIRTEKIFHKRKNQSVSSYLGTIIWWICISVPGWYLSYLFSTIFIVFAGMLLSQFITIIIGGIAGAILFFHERTKIMKNASIKNTFYQLGYHTVIGAFYLTVFWFAGWALLTFLGGGF